MHKVRKIKFINHPILKNLEFNFVGMDGKAIDTVIFAGENGCGNARSDASARMELIFP